MAKTQKRRHYSDSAKAEALAALDANAGDLSKTARQLKIPRSTLQRWQGERSDLTDLRQEKKKALADRLEDVAHALVDDLARPEKLERASLQQVATTLGIAVDKMQLLRGGTSGPALVSVSLYLPSKDHVEGEADQATAGTGTLPQKLG